MAGGGDLGSVILDWKKNNQIRKDRYAPSIYQKELFELGITSDSNFLGLPDGNQNAVFGNQNGNQRETQDRIGKVNTLTSGFADREPDKPESKARAKKTFPPDSDAYQAACCLRDEIAQRLPTSTPPSEKQLQSWVRFLLAMLKDYIAEKDPKKKEAKLAEIVDNLQKTLED